MSPTRSTFTIFELLLPHFVTNIFSLLMSSSLGQSSGSLRRVQIEKNVDDIQSELDKLLASNFADLGFDLSDPSFLNVHNYIFN